MRVARSRPRPLPPRAPAYGSRPQGVALQQCTGQIGRVGMRKAKAPQGCTNATGISARMHTKAAWTPDLAARSHATQSGRWTRLTIECVYLEATVQKRLLRPGDEC
ncbi:uncharacterized protein LOC143269020 isoform X2 [Peromyscus maniculatus bairdii]|uniref:uncharacterized protein LOC143269020 isoform X2 n=1 Tax=Peromyscus maniculatus bairdii TaxID=230844 RepID=UPI003FD59D18